MPAQGFLVRRVTQGTGSLQADVLRRRISWRKEERLFPGSEVRGTAFVYCKEVLELLPH